MAKRLSEKQRKKAAMDRRQALAFGGSVAAIVAVGAGVLWFTRGSKDSDVVADAATVIVHKDASCGCCAKWVDHLRQAGFKVAVRNEASIDAVKTRLGVPAKLASCHTAELAGYVIEGHVPAQDIQRLIRERPIAKGLAVAGMPQGSPGMETDGRADPYDVILFGGDVPEAVFAHHDAAN